MKDARPTTNSATTATTTTARRLADRSCLFAAIIAVELVLHAAYVTSSAPSTFRIHHPHGHTSLSSPSLSSASAPVPGSAGFPELFVFRRTKKTGSSSMMNALMSSLEALGYDTLPQKRHELEIVVRNKYTLGNSAAQSQSTPISSRHLLVMHHNNVTKNMHPARSVVIADTIRDGFAHMTSYCRFMRKVRTCGGAAMRACFEDALALQQNTYRWAGRSKEDVDTYIDLPLSAAHPALSTTVLRTVFPDAAPLVVRRYNDKSKACRVHQVDADLRDLYARWYAPLEEQVATLRARLLVLAGYPVKARPAKGVGETEADVGLDEMLDAAEIIERRKYEFDEDELGRPVEGKSQKVLDLLAMVLKWRREDNGSVTLVQRRENF